MMRLYNFKKPIIFDNKNLRKIYKDIESHFLESKKEMDQFPKINGFIRDELLVDSISCPCCGNDCTKQWCVKWGGRYDKCYQCNHIFLKNPFKKEMQRQLYKKSLADELNRKVMKNDYSVKYWNAVYKKYISVIRYLYHNDNKLLLLDVGCGTGHFLEVCGSENILAHGVDVYEGMIEELKDRLSEHHLHSVSDIVDFDISEKYGVITLWGVLEHLSEPHKIFNKCSDLLNDQGLLLALIPNISSRAVRLLGVSTPTLNPRQHIYILQKSKI